MSASMAHPPQSVIDWINVAVRYVEAGGIGCRECRDGTPSAAKKRGHVECAMSRSAVFAAWDMRTFLTQPAETWFGMDAAPPDLSEMDAS